MAHPQTSDLTPDELSAAYRSAGLHRIRYGLARALETPSIYRALRLTALVLRKKQHGQPAPERRATEMENAA